MRNRQIYLDYAATTPVDSKVLAAMKPYFSQKFGNPMSLHSLGQEANLAIEKARTQIAQFLNCQNKEIIFTSGATESNNLAIKGIVYNYWARHNQKPHIITSLFEHHCVLESCKNLEKSQLAEVTYLPVYKDGIVKTEDVKKAIRKNTALVSIMYVNNEIGTVQPISKIGKIIKKHNSQFSNLKSQIIFHTDATQAINFFDCDVRKLNVDLLSLSGHKIYGPKGIGALYLKKGIPIQKIQNGGEQEFRLRSGTHNVPGIVGLAVAIQNIKHQKSNIKRITSLRDYLIRRVLKEISGSHLNGSPKFRSPNNANFRFDNIEGESLVLMLAKFGIATSTGSACSSGTLEPSHVLLALGLRPEQAHGSLRLTLGKDTTQYEIDLTIDVLKSVVKNLRKISGDILKSFK